MKIYSTTQNFKGISNPITNLVRAQNALINIFSVQLDNMDTKDLNTFRDIKQRLNFHPKEVEGDVLNINLIEMDDGTKGFFVNGKPILQGNDLRQLSEYNFETKAAMEAYKEDERAHLKLYTFIADLTKRISNRKSLPIDEDLHHVAKSTFAYMSEIYVDHTLFINKIIYNSLLRPKPFQEHASMINEFVQNTMRVFFR